MKLSIVENFAIIIYSFAYVIPSCIAQQCVTDQIQTFVKMGRDFKESLLGCTKKSPTLFVDKTNGRDLIEEFQANYKDVLDSFEDAASGTCTENLCQYKNAINLAESIGNVSKLMKKIKDRVDAIPEEEIKSKRRNCLIDVINKVWKSLITNEDCFT